MDEATLAGWAAHACGAAALGDARRTARLVALAGALVPCPADLALTRAPRYAQRKCAPHPAPAAS